MKNDMEHDPSAAISAETTTEDKKSKKRRKRSTFRAPLSVDQKEDTGAKKPEPSQFEAALLHLQDTKRTERTEPKDKQAATDAAVDSSAETTDETDETDEADQAEESKWAESTTEAYELRPNQIGGEILIDLSGPVSELVVPLHEDSRSRVPSADEQVAAVEPELGEPLVATQQAAESVQEHYQPEQQPTAAPEDELAEKTESVAEVEQSDLPPEVLPPGFNQAPAQAYRQYMERRAAARPGASATEFVTRAEMEDELYRAEKAGQNHGVVAGALVFGGYEHLKHRKREKRQNKIIKKQQQQFERLRTQNQWLQEQNDRPKAEDTSLRKSERRFPVVDKALESKLANRFERYIPKKLRPPELKQHDQDQLQVPEDHRLEQSAWHTIEVDARTGKAVEQPAFQYGHEYYQERDQESGPRDHVNSAAGEVALVASSLSSQTSSDAQQTDSHASGHGQNKPYSTDNSLSGKVKDAVKTGSQALTQTNDGPLWPWLVALAVVVICLVVAIH